MFDFERAEKPEETPGNAKQQESIRRFAVVQGGRKAGEAKVERPESALILEGHIFSKEEILSLIRFLAEREGFKREDLIPQMERYDAKENLMALRLKIKSGRAEGTGFKQVIYEYLIKGVHGQGDTRGLTVVERTFTPYDTRKEPQKDTVARYDENKDQWIYTLTELALSRTDLKPNKK